MWVNIAWSTLQENSIFRPVLLLKLFFNTQNITIKCIIFELSPETFQHVAFKLFAISVHLAWKMPSLLYIDHVLWGPFFYASVIYYLLLRAYFWGPKYFKMKYVLIRTILSIPIVVFLLLYTFLVLLSWDIVASLLHIVVAFLMTGDMIREIILIRQG